MIIGSHRLAPVSWWQLDGPLVLFCALLFAMICLLFMAQMDIGENDYLMVISAC